MGNQNHHRVRRVSSQIFENLPLCIPIQRGKRVDVYKRQDYLYANGEGHWFEGKRIDNPNTHGTGCTLSSAIASNLAKGYELPEAVKRAKDYILSLIHI